MPEFKVPEGSRDERRDSTVAISIPDLARFNRIKGFLAFKSGRIIESTQVTHELIEAWITNNGGLGDSEG